MDRDRRPAADRPGPRRGRTGRGSDRRQPAGSPAIRAMRFSRWDSLFHGQLPRARNPCRAAEDDAAKIYELFTCFGISGKTLYADCKDSVECGGKFVNGVWWE